MQTLWCLPLPAPRLTQRKHTHLAVSTVARGVLAALRNATGKPGLSCETLLDGHAFAKACVALDELLPQGVLETTDEETLHSGAKMKLPISK